MKSPFPGMDPYIEACKLWKDFHLLLIGRICDALAEALPERYVVRAGERSYVEMVQAEGKEQHPFEPDVNVLGPAPSKGTDTLTASVAVAETQTEEEVVSLRAFVAEEFRENFVEIYNQEAEPYLVTCIEVMSPSNKRPGTKGWKQYHRKRQGLLLGAANFIEIDLLRGGQKMPMLDPWPQCPYTLLVYRQLHARCSVHKAYSLRPLPVIPVPLVAPDPPLSLALQPMIEAIYERSRYHRSIDYTKPCPGLSPEEVAFLQEQLKARQSPA